MSASDRYNSAGVNIAAGESFISRISPLVDETHKTLAAHGAQMALGMGGFAAAVQLPSGMKSPVLLTCVDGVGTKVKLAAKYVDWQVIGCDAVAMCVNDLLCTGAKPLAFLDYYACDSLNADEAAQVVAGIADACVVAGCALVGGETAEMPGVYAAGCFDVAGFAVGVAEKEQIIKPEQVQVGDIVIGIASSGPHSNGYSLIRRILHDNPSCEAPAAVFAPTRIYCRSVAALGNSPHGIAHITGGGLAHNLARVLPAGVVALLHPYALPEAFVWLQKTGGLSEDEMHRVFNCGVGLAVIVAADNAAQVLQILADNNENAWRLGVIQQAANKSAAPAVWWANEASKQ